MDHNEIYDRYASYVVDQTYQLINSSVTISGYKMQFMERQKCLLNKLQHHYFKMTKRDLVAILIYIERLKSSKSKSFIRMVNISYILLALVILYLKMYDDKWYANSFYANWTHLDLRTLNDIEKNICDNITLFITHQEYNDKRNEYNRILYPK